MSRGAVMSKVWKRHMRWSMNVWFPFMGAGIRVTRLDEDWKAVDVEMKLRFWNANYVGTHYGGSLYSMADPFYMLMLLEALGSDYIVWDKAASIRFRKPGKGTVRAEFRLTQAMLNDVKDRLTMSERSEPIFYVQ